MGLSFSDHNDTQLKELEWMYSRLTKAKQGEKSNKEESNAVTKWQTRF